MLGFPNLSRVPQVFGIRFPHLARVPQVFGRKNDIPSPAEFEGLTCLRVGM